MKLNKEPRDGSVALLFASYQPSLNSARLLDIALKSIEKFAYPNVDVWVADVGSPKSDFMLTGDDHPNVNFLFSDVTPRSWVGYPLRKRVFRQLLGRPAPRNGSFANAWTLDYGIRTFKELGYRPKYIMTLQMDVMFTHAETVPRLVDLIETDERCFASGVLEQKSFAHTHNILHSLGCLWSADAAFKPDFDLFPDFPQFDVGEGEIARLTDAGGVIRSFANSYSDPSIIENLPPNVAEFNVDRAIDENGELMFLHLGRGILKSHDKYKKPNKVYFPQWEAWFKEHLL